MDKKDPHRRCKTSGLGRHGTATIDVVLTQPQVICPCVSRECPLTIQIEPGTLQHAAPYIKASPSVCPNGADGMEHLLGRVRDVCCGFTSALKTSCFAFSLQPGRDIRHPSRIGQVHPDGLVCHKPMGCQRRRRWWSRAAWPIDVLRSLRPSKDPNPNWTCVFLRVPSRGLDVRLHFWSSSGSRYHSVIDCVVSLSRTLYSTFSNSAPKQDVIRNCCSVYP